jgi:hypothetical protein
MDVQGAEAGGLTAAVREIFVIEALQLMIHSLVGFLSGPTALFQRAFAY